MYHVNLGIMFHCVRTTECHVSFNKDNFIYSVGIDPISRIDCLLLAMLIRVMKFLQRCISWSWCLRPVMIDIALTGNALFIRRIRSMDMKEWRTIHVMNVNRFVCAEIDNTSSMSFTDIS